MLRNQEEVMGLGRGIESSGSIFSLSDEPGATSTLYTTKPQALLAACPQPLSLSQLDCKSQLADSFGAGVNNHYKSLDTGARNLKSLATQNESE